MKQHRAGDVAPDDGRRSDTPGRGRPELVRVLESAARLQQVVPDSVLVGGSAAALWASHRTSLDHDHVLADLGMRFDAVLDAIEATDGWVTNRVTPGKIILGELGEIESGVRQLMRSRPLEVTEVRLPSGQTLRVPTQLARQLADPRPADARTVQQLQQNKALDERWTDWRSVTEVCRSVAAAMVL
jgi:hypothetical protein